MQTTLRAIVGWLDCDTISKMADVVLMKCQQQVGTKRKVSFMMADILSDDKKRIKEEEEEDGEEEELTVVVDEKFKKGKVDFKTGELVC